MNYRALRLVIALYAAIGTIAVVAGCSSTSGIVAPPTVAIQQACLATPDYTPAQQKALATEIAALPADDPLVLAMIDYGRVRAENRACLAHNH